jgi:hypothetical protein
MNPFAQCVPPLVDIDAFIAHIGSGGQQATGWALMLALTILGAVIAIRAAVHGIPLPLATRLVLPRSVAIERERSWPKHIVFGVFANVLFANAIVYTAFIGFV